MEEDKIDETGNRPKQAYISLSLIASSKHNNESTKMDNSLFASLLN